MKTGTDQIECSCGGAIKNCLYCQGTGRITAQDKQAIDQLIAETRVLVCPACGQQNRVRQIQLDRAEPLHCYVCTAPLLNQSVNPFTRSLTKPD